MFDRTDSTGKLVVPVVLILLALGGILFLAMAACALTSQTPPTPAPTATNVPSSVVVVPQEVVVTPTSDPALLFATVTAAAALPTQTPFVVTQVAVQPVAITPLQVSLPANCQVRSDWQPYVVQAGDTVGDLAIATNTALADLIVGNCLTTPDIINVGQTLYLPRQPVNYLLPATTAPVAATSVPAGVAPQIGFVMVEPAVVDEGRYLIAPGNVTVRAQGVSNATSVTFYLSAVGTETPPVLIGTDNNMADGAVLLWQVTNTTPFVANVWAVATSAGGLEESTDPILVANNG